MAEQSDCDLKNGNEETFSKQVIAYLHDIIKDPGLHNALHFFTTGQIGNHKECILKMTSILVTIAPQFIQFPSGEELIETKEKFYRLSQSVNNDFGFPNVIGVIDCERVKFVQESSINVQFVCGPDLQFYNVLAAFSGQCDNLQIWNNSKLRTQLTQQEDDNKCWLIGSSNYLQDSVLMCPVFQAKNEPEKLYNRSHSIVYKCIKRALYLLKKRFKCLEMVLDFNPHEVCAITIACCVLHNICIRLCDYNIDYNYLLLIANLEDDDDDDWKENVIDVNVKENGAEENESAHTDIK